MDTYFELRGSNIPHSDHMLVAACCLLLGAKAVELDDRIPFISKLKKYTSVHAPREQFKFYEVDIALCMNWDLQQITFYDFVQHYLSKAVVSEDDKIFNRLLNSFNGVSNFNVKPAELLEKVVKYNELETQIYSCSSGPKAFNSSSFKDPMFTIKSFNKINLKEDGSTEMQFLNPVMKENSLMFFESYVDLISETLQKCYTPWNFDKKKLAVCIILFARSSLFNGANTWNLRLEELTELHLNDIRDCFSSICQFFSHQKTASSHIHTGSIIKPPSSTSLNPKKNLNMNSNLNSTNSLTSDSIASPPESFSNLEILSHQSNHNYNQGKKVYYQASGTYSFRCDTQSTTSTHNG